VANEGAGPTAVDDISVPTKTLSLVVIGERGVAEYTLPERGRLLLGRVADADVRIDDARVSRTHAALYRDVGATRIEDLGSANGTLVGGNRLAPHEQVALDAGQTVQIGSHVLFLQRTRVPRARAEAPPGSSPLVVESSEMRRLYALAEKVAASNVNVLILGETGTGKDVLAKKVHEFSPRSSGPFVRLNCATLSDTLLESELFGYERGAFTGAVAAKAGLLESAEGGTVFLDELGELSARVQAKLLQVIELREVTRLGSIKTRRIDVRFVSATNRSLEKEMTDGSFRRDLFFRLNGFMFRVPPLRERVVEIVPLARRFAVDALRKMGRSGTPALTEDAERLLARHDWPGNIRELRTVIERALVLHAGDSISAENLVIDANQPAVTPTAITGPPIGSSGDDERNRILAVLAECAWNQTRAAKRLGMARSTLVTRLDAYRIDRPRKGQVAG
jgi:transcriptional regulator with PAS, ATPase and Fis domain